MRQRRLALIEEVDTAIIGFRAVVEVFVLHIDEFLAMDIFIGDIGLSSSRLAGGDVDFEALVGLTDMSQVFRLEIEVAGIESKILVGRLKNGLRMMLEGDIVRIDIGGLQANGSVVPTAILTYVQEAVLLGIARQVAIHVHADIKLLMGVGECQIVGIARHSSTNMRLLVEHHKTAREIHIVHVVAKDH